MSNREVQFYQIVSQQRWGAEMQNLSHITRMALYLTRTRELAKTFEIADFPNVSIPDTLPPTPQAAESALLPAYYLIENYLIKLHARNIFAIDNIGAYVSLNETWRSRASSYVSHIRNVVDQAQDLPERLRQSIFHKLNELQAEIDRKQTRITAAVDALNELCIGIGAGAKNLEPAVRLVERLSGALGGLRKEDAPEIKQLPAPDKLGLPKPNDSGTSGEGEGPAA